MKRQNEENVWEKSYDAYALSSTDHNKPLFNFSVFMFFYHNINVKENICFFVVVVVVCLFCFFHSANRKRHCVTHWREKISDWFVLSMRMQVILDSIFVRAGRKESSGTGLHMDKKTRLKPPEKFLEK